MGRPPPGYAAGTNGDVAGPPVIVTPRERIEQGIDYAIPVASHESSTVARVVRHIWRPDSYGNLSPTFAATRYAPLALRNDAHDARTLPRHHVPGRSRRRNPTAAVAR